MTPDIDHLTETFSAHESLAPDAAEVLERAHGIARSYHRRRWAVRATGGAVLGAAVVAGSIGISGELGNNNASGSSNAAAFSPAAGASTPTASSYTEQQELDAYFNAGFDYDNAVALGQLWHSSDLVTVKAQAGLKLLDGDTLPVTPNQPPASAQDKALQAYFEAGYDYYDAEDLATIWHETDLTQVKTEAGQKLEAGDALPIKPGAGDAVETPVGESPAQLKDDAARTAFFEAGYSYEDAVKLADLWHVSDTFQVKAAAGKKLEAGESLPIPPSGPAEVISPRSVVVGASVAARKAALRAARKAGLTHKVVVVTGRSSH